MKIKRIVGFGLIGLSILLVLITVTSIILSLISSEAIPWALIIKISIAWFVAFWYGAKLLSEEQKHETQAQDSQS